MTSENILDSLNSNDISKKITPNHHNPPKRKKISELPGNKNLRGNFVAC